MKHKKSLSRFIKNINFRRLRKNQYKIYYLKVITKYKLKNYKPTFPQIFSIINRKELYLDIEYNSKIILMKTILEYDDKQNIFKQSKEIYIKLIEFLNKLEQPHLYYKVEKLDPYVIARCLQAYQQAKPNSSEEIESYNAVKDFGEIIVNYCYNCLVVDANKEEAKYYYFTLKGLQKVDLFLQTYNYKTKDATYMSRKYNETVSNALLEKFKNLRKMHDKKTARISLDDVCNDVLNKILGANIKDADITRIIINQVTDTISNSNIVKEEVEKYKIDRQIMLNDITWDYTGKSFTKFCQELSLGLLNVYYNLYLKRLRKELFNEIMRMIKLFYSKILSEKEMSTMEELFFSNIKYDIKNKKVSIINEINRSDDSEYMKLASRIENLLKKNRTRLNIDVIHIETNIYLYYNINTKNTMINDIEKFYPEIFAPYVTYYLRTNFEKFKLTLGAKLFELINDILVKRNTISYQKSGKHKAMDLVYIRSDYHKIILKANLFPHFGKIKLNKYDISEIYKKNKTADKFIVIHDNLDGVNEGPIKHSGKYNIINISEAFKEQLVFTENSFCMPNLYGFFRYLNIITNNFDSLLYQNMTQTDITHLGLFMPNDTNLHFLNENMEKNAFLNLSKRLMDITNLTIDPNEKKLKMQGKETIMELLAANITIKYELKAIVDVSLVMVGFFGWYPLVNVDARGRQRPSESVINITKSTKHRTLFNYVHPYQQPEMFRRINSQFDEITLFLKKVKSHLINKKNKKKKTL